MIYITENLGSSGKTKFAEAEKYLLPNEDTIFVCRTQAGFLVLSNRRVVILSEQKDQSYTITRVIPFDCILGYNLEKKDRFKLVAIELDEYGCHESKIKDGSSQYITREIEVRVPRSEKNESKEDVTEYFQEAVKHFIDALDGLRGSETSIGASATQRDLSYLDILPESLTQNAVLDLNNVLQDKPIHDELCHEAMKFLGSDAFLLEESLRDGLEKNSGVLFAAGKLGYIWIRGNKEGRYLSNVLVDKVEWDNIICFVHRWQEDDGHIKAIYTLQKGSRELAVPYVWSPKTDEGTRQYPWLLQKLNGPWILADIMYEYSGKPLPASCMSEGYLQNPELQKQRYYI